MISSCRLSPSEKPPGGSASGKSFLSGFPFITFITIALAAAGVNWGGQHASPGAIIAALSLATITLIIYGERFALDRALENLGLPGRDAYIPVIALSVAGFLT